MARLRGGVLTALALVAGCHDWDSLSFQFNRDGGSRDLSLVFPSSCNNKLKDGDETDLDCGGSCRPCVEGRSCLRAKDCVGLLCANNRCGTSLCGDGVKNGAETDLDCGGGACPGCAGGRACLVAADCASATCQNGVCGAAPIACADGMQSSGETDVDCGGPSCPPCPDGKRCLMGRDCASATCGNNVCKAASCSDGVKNGAETDPDCGGGSCPRCANGRACLQASDCVSAKCTASRCTDINVFNCADAIDCVRACGANTNCALGCPGKITTAQGRKRFDTLIQCFEGACPSSQGKPCDRNGPQYPASCDACTKTAQGGACAAPSTACAGDV